MTSLVIGGLSSTLLPTHGLGGASDGGNANGKSVIYIENGDLLINVERVVDDIVLFYNDGVNAFSRILPVSNDQLSGTEYIPLWIVRIGTDISISIHNGTEIKTLPNVSLDPTVKAHGGNVVVMRKRSGSIFDINFAPRSINDKHKEYYIKDLEENNGRSLIPL